MADWGEIKANLERLLDLEKAFPDHESEPTKHAPKEEIEAYQKRLFAYLEEVSGLEKGQGEKRSNETLATFYVELHNRFIAHEKKYGEVLDGASEAKRFSVFALEEVDDNRTIKQWLDNYTVEDFHDILESLDRALKRNIVLSHHNSFRESEQAKRAAIAFHHYPEFKKHDNHTDGAEVLAFQAYINENIKDLEGFTEEEAELAIEDHKAFVQDERIYRVGGIGFGLTAAAALAGGAMFLRGCGDHEQQELPTKSPKDTPAHVEEVETDDAPRPFMKPGFISAAQQISQDNTR